MKQRFTLFRRAKVFYCEDTTTRQQLSLRTKDEAEAIALLNAKNEAFRQPILNIQMARTYLSATDPEIGKRTWQASMDEMAKTKTGPTLSRHHVAMLEKPFDLIRALPILETLVRRLPFFILKRISKEYDFHNLKSGSATFRVFHGASEPLNCSTFDLETQLGNSFRDGKSNDPSDLLACLP